MQEGELTNYLSAIWTMCKHSEEYSVCLRTRGQTKSVKFNDWNNHSLKTEDTWQKYLLVNYEVWNCSEKRVIVFKVFKDFFCKIVFNWYKRFNQLLLKDENWKLNNTLSSSASFLICDQKNILPNIQSLQTVNNSGIKLLKLFAIGFPNKRCKPRHVYI